jgi:regulator of protease activity HflC (stomatin/prohibitin superfamily)
MKNMTTIRWLLGLTIATSQIACATISPGERGIRKTLGKLHEDTHGPGVVGHWPFVTTVVRVPVRTTMLELNVPLPTREGLTVAAEVSILYHVRERSIRDILETIGPNYEEEVVLTAFRSAAANVASQHDAKSMHSGTRAEIEQEIKTELAKTIEPRGFEVESVLLKSIDLPAELTRAIEAKLAAEQQQEQMVFVLETERFEADRKRVEAEGIRDAQRIVDQGLSPLLIQWRAIEAFRDVSKSPNAKIIITDGSSPLMLPATTDPAPAAPRSTQSGRSTR